MAAVKAEADRAKVRRKISSGPGKGHIVVGADKQPVAQVLLQLGDVFGHALLGHIHTFGSLGEAQGVAKGEKAPDGGLVDHVGRLLA